MKMIPVLLAFALYAPQSWPDEDDAENVRVTIEGHYAAINAQEESKALSDHLESFTMFPGDGGLLFEPDWVQVQERVGQEDPLPELNVRMTHFNVEIYEDVAVATFYLVGTQTINGESSALNNRVSAVWVREGSSWKEAHHHESRLLPGD